MLTLFTYICAAFFLGFVTRSVGLPMLVYVAYHFCFYRPLFGTGILDEIEYDVFYTLGFGLHAVVGFTLAWALNVPPLLFGYSRAIIPCEKHAVVLKGRSMGGVVLKYIYRLVIGLVVFWLIMGGALAFELIPTFLSWLGIIVAIVVIIIAHLIFYFALRKGGHPADFKNIQAVYLSLKKGVSCVLCGRDMTIDVVLYMAAYYIVTTITFCAVFVAVPWFWQFYTVLIIFGAAMLFYGIVCSVLTRPKKQMSEAVKKAKLAARQLQAGEACALPESM